MENSRFMFQFAFPKGRVPVGGIPDSLISNHLLVLTVSNVALCFFQFTPF